MPTKAMTQKGILSQNIQRQFECSANAPPMTGPLTEPIAHIRLIQANHRPLSLKDTMSVMMTYVSALSPPPPTPCTVRPTRRVVIFWAMAEMTAPAVNNVRATRSTDLRPNMWEREAHVGWKTVLVRRKEVPAQNASIAVPLRSAAIS